MYKNDFILKELLKLSKREKVDIFLVGGFLRDLLLQKKTVDYDIVIDKDAKELARKFSKNIKGAFVLLDDENKIYRVVKRLKKKQNTKEAVNIDFSQMRGESIEDDLALRDFSVNAIAIKLDVNSVITGIRENIIDPFGGMKDLRKKIIRAVDDRIFTDDPLRLLRAFRLAAVLNFKIEIRTKRLIKKDSNLIKKVSGERIHEEIIKILSVKDSSDYIVEIDNIKLLSRIIPEIEPIKKAFRYYYHKKGLWGHSLDSLRAFEEIDNNLSRLFPKVRNELKAYLDELIVNGVKRYTILKFAALFHDIGKPETLTRKEGKVRFFGHEEKSIKIVKKIMLRLRFSNRETRTAEKVIRFHMRPGTLSQNKVITDKAIWRFFRDTLDEGIGVLLVSLADYYAYRRQAESQKDIRKHGKAIRKILYRYFIHREVVKPRLLLNGTDIMRNFSLPQGPMIGKLLGNLEEAQAESKIKNKKGALSFINSILKRKQSL